MSKYEQLIEYIINENEDKARELFHQIVVEKSREIYESLIDESDLEEMGNNPVDAMVDEITSEEQGMSEGEDEMDIELDSEEDDDGMDMGDDMGGEGELEDRVMDLEDALDELKAEFDALMADEAHEPEHHDGIDDPEFVGAEEEGAPEEFFEDAEEDDDEEEEDLDETIVREYVEKVGDTGQGSESGKMAGTGAKTPASGGKQTKSTVASKNDMGGTAAFSKGGNADQDGNSPAPSEKPKGDLVSNPQNKPGANAGKTAFKKKEPGHGAEKKGAAPGPVGSGTGDKAGQTSVKPVQQMLKPVSK